MMPQKGQKLPKVPCTVCSKHIAVTQINAHEASCAKIKSPRKIRGVDYDPNWGYAAGIRTAWNKGRKSPTTNWKTSHKEAFVENSTVSRKNIKKRILQDSLIAYNCNECGLDSSWNGKELVLHLDHINGICNDHRLENLQFLCPNCHSQTSTYAGKNKANKNKASLAEMV